MSEKLSLCRDLSVYLGERPLVERVTIEVTSHSVTALVGPSGIGKTVLAEVIFGLRPRSRTDIVRVVGGELGAAAVEGALVFQQGGGIGHLNLRQNLALVRDGDEENRTLLDRLDLSPLADQAANSLSVGEARRLAVAQGIAAGRRLLWIDEPAAGLDLWRAEVLAKILRELADGGAAVLVTSHQPEFIDQIAADHLLFFDCRRVLAPEAPPAGGPDAVRARIREFLRSTTQEQAPPSRAGEGQPPGEFAGQKTKPRRPFSDRLARSFVALNIVANTPRELQIGLESVPRAARRNGWETRETLRVALRLAAGEGALFYPLVGAIFALVFILVLKISVEPLLSATTALANYGPMFVVRFSPAMAGILVAARAGASTSAWIGQLTFSRQLDALHLLRSELVPRLAGPGWAGLLAGGLAGTLSFALSLIAVFSVYLALASGGSTVAKMWSNFEAMRILAAVLKTVLYSAVISAATMASARQPKLKVEEVASDLTQGIVVSTVLVMLLEALLLAGEWWKEAIL